MNLNPLVSVLINNYNYREFLPEAIESVLSQTYGNYELIIVDDGSTDNSREIIERYFNKYPNLIKPIYKSNGGQASAFNAGFAASKGDIIAFLDSDDYWFLDKLSKIVEVHRKYSIVQHNLLINGKEKYTQLRNDIDMTKMLKEFGYIYNFITTSGLSFSRAILENIFPIPEEPLKICAETYVRFNAIYFTGVYSIDEALGYYRVHGNNQWHNRYSEKKSIENTERIVIELNKRMRLLHLPEIPIYNKDLNIEMAFSTIPVEMDKRYLLYGNGGMSEKFSRLIEEKNAHVVLYSDTNPDKWNTEFMGKPVIPPQEINLIDQGVDSIIIASMYIDDILNLLTKLGFKEGKEILIPLIL